MKFRVQGNELQLAIPRASLGLPKGPNRLHLDFKWTDNLQHPGDITDFLVSGDVSPDGRFKYRFEGE